MLLAAYLGALGLALLSCFLLEIPLWASLSGVLLCLLHGAWAVPRQIRLDHPSAFTGLRRDERGWQLWSRAAGWQPVQLQRDSLALPWLVVLRLRRQGDRWPRSICVPRDALASDLHRRLRVRLKFSRRRWAAPG
nr:protein YgfX [Pseudomonas gingeri]